MVKIPTDVITLSDAYAMHIRALGKYWAFAATVAVVAFTADTSSGSVELFGFKLRESNFYPACAIFGAILNFAYCVSHLQAYRAGNIFRSYLSSLDLSKEKIDDNNTLLDAIHLLYPSAVNRVYPVFHFLPPNVSKRMIQIIKMPVDLFVFLVPISGCIYATSQIRFDWLVLAIWCLVVASSSMLILLTFTSIRWLVSNHEQEPSQ